MHISQFTMIFKYHILSIVTYYNFNLKGDKQMNELTVLELMDIKMFLRILGDDFVERTKNWYDNDFDKQFGAPIWEEYYTKIKYLHDKLEKVIAEELDS